MMISVLLILLFAATSFPLKIVATINPYYLILKEITGEETEVDLLVGPGQNPHIFSPKISDIRKLNEADLVIANGLDLEVFLNPYLEDLSLRGKTVVYVGSILPDELLVDEKEKSDDDASGHHDNPHVWLDPIILSDYVVPFLVSTLSSLDPGNSEFFTSNAADLIKNLQEFNDETASYMERFEGKTVIVAHPSFSYFFKRYGILLEPVLQGVGDEPTIGEIMKLVDFVRSQDVIGMFAEYQHSKRAIDILMDETSVKHGELDSLGISTESIMELLQWNLVEIKKVFDGE
ncbi:MAG TPA: zinc ABC transporter substrate-binding protein [Mesotoga infera]|uniref:Zinc ABC transporter substrate-binding protein n=1 Tax=Mesotoga infera TaxID=1236046 RepID=A0A7C1CX31_9BACT|nr:zinc ABC transporter substrate-binding protein [Mesotoga infera]